MFGFSKNAVYIPELLTIINAPPPSKNVLSLHKQTINYDEKKESYSQIYEKCKSNGTLKITNNNNNTILILLQYSKKNDVVMIDNIISNEQITYKPELFSSKTIQMTGYYAETNGVDNYGTWNKNIKDSDLFNKLLDEYDELNIEIFDKGTSNGGKNTKRRKNVSQKRTRKRISTK
jgi:hypothetical protein